MQTSSQVPSDGQLGGHEGAQSAEGAGDDGAEEHDDNESQSVPYAVRNSAQVVTLLKAAVSMLEQ